MTDNDLLNLPRCTDSRNFLMMRHMSFLSPIAYFADEEDLIPVLTCRMMQMSLRSGVSEMSPFAFAGWAIAMSVMNDFEGAVKFGRLALRLMERFPQDARTLVTVHGLISNLSKPLQACIDDTLNGYHLAFSKGDLKYAEQAIVTHFSMRFRGGFPLENYIKDMFSFCRQLRKYRQSLMFLYLLFLLRTALEITDRSKDISSLLGKKLNDEEFEDYIRKGNGKQALFNFWICHIESRYYLGDMDSALAYGEKCWRVERRTLAFLYLPSYFTFSALTSLRFWKKTRKRRHWRIFRKYHRKIKNWVKQGNPNSRHLDALLDAELLATKMNKHDAMREAYETSILLACQGGYLQDAALASELAGRFFLRTRFDAYWARYYLSSAKDLFASWNATAKVKQMQEEYGRFVHPDEEPDTLSSSHTSRSKLWNLPSHGRSRSSLVNQIESERCNETLMEPIATNEPKDPKCDGVSESKMEIY